MKKILLVCLIALLALAMFATCKSSDDDVEHADTTFLKETVWEREAGAYIPAVFTINEDLTFSCVITNENTYLGGLSTEDEEDLLTECLAKFGPTLGAQLFGTVTTVLYSGEPEYDSCVTGKLDYKGLGGNNYRMKNLGLDEGDELFPGLNEYTLGNVITILLGLNDMEGALITLKPNTAKDVFEFSSTDGYADTTFGGFYYKQ